MRKAIDRTGQRFGRLVAISREENSCSGRTRWRCKCDCGNETVVSGSHLASGNTSSCGCLQRERVAKANTRHGHTVGGENSKTFATWIAMIGRVTQKNSAGYHNYGGRGIAICDRWSEFSNFLSDMGYTPEGMTLERVDNSLGYYPENCRWASHTRQNRNSRNTKLSLEKARAIRADFRRYKDIADDYGVSITAVFSVKKHQTWKENQILFYEPTAPSTTTQDQTP